MAIKSRKNLGQPVRCDKLFFPRLLLIRVSFYLVRFPVARLTECLVTILALIRLLPGVGAPVPFQVAGLSERFATNLAFKRLLPGVNTLVFFQVAGVSERFATNLAFKRILPGVSAQVSDEFLAG